MATSKRRLPSFKTSSYTTSSPCRSAVPTEARHSRPPLVLCATWNTPSTRGDRRPGYGCGREEAIYAHAREREPRLLYQLASDPGTLYPKEVPVTSQSSTSNRSLPEAACNVPCLSTLSETLAADTRTRALRVFASTRDLADLEHSNPKIVGI